MLPPDVLPERRTVVIVVEQEHVAFGNRGVMESVETPREQSIGDTTTTKAWNHREVMQVAAAAIMTAEHSTHDLSGVGLADSAHSRVAFKIRNDGVQRVGLVQANSVCPTP